MSLLLSVMAASQPTASAKTDQKNWYKVEIIIFSQVPYGEKQNEIWPELPAFSLPQSAYTLIPPQVYIAQQGANALTYPLLTNKDFTLAADANHISHNPNYKMIGHMAWLQPINPENKQLQPTYIQASNGETTFDGLLTLSLKHFIQFNLQAITAINDTAFSGDWKNKNKIDDDGVIRFGVNRSIRIRSKELNYVDTPFVGVLFEVSPHANPIPAH
jgi:hypothetical protein